MSTTGHPSDVEPRAADLRVALERARCRLDEARRDRDRAVAARRRRAVSAPVHVFGTVVLVVAFVLPGLVVAYAYGRVQSFPCLTYARVKVEASWALASWVLTALAWAWLRRRRYTSAEESL